MSVIDETVVVPAKHSPRSETRIGNSFRTNEGSSGRNWFPLYQERLTSAACAVGRIGSGQRVFVGSNCAEPQTLVDALPIHASNLTHTEIVHIMTMGHAPYSEARFAKQFHHNAFFIGANVREAVNACRADYTPIFLSEIPALFRSGTFPIDVAMILVSPPDTHGYCSLGISIDVVKAAVETAGLVIAEVNPQMPRTLGDSFLHVSQIDAFVESDCPLLELSLHPQTEATRTIGRHIAELIEDGSTLQMGIGAIPDAVLACLTDKRDLGVHTEMFSDGLMPLVEAGIRERTSQNALFRQDRLLVLHGDSRAVRLRRQQSLDRVPSDGGRQRSVCDRAEREDGCHQCRNRSGSHRAGLRRFHRGAVLQRNRRAGRLFTRSRKMGRMSSSMASFSSLAQRSMMS